MEEHLEELLEKFVTAGYNYAKSVYDSWKERNEVEDEDSYYHDSIDTNGLPKKIFFKEQILEESLHNYCSGDLQDCIDTFDVDIVLSDEDNEVIKRLDEEYLYDYLREGIDNFITDTY